MLIYRLLIIMLLSIPAVTQESPYFVAYDHHTEEPGNLEIETSSTFGAPRAGEHVYFAPYTELEYGVTTRWTAELYLESQYTAGDSAVFTGWRFENRYRLLKREHLVNPMLYLEYENTNEATKIQKEVVGYAADLDEPNSVLARERAHELETKLILSSTTHDWNIAENFIVEKNLSEGEGFEFGYALGISRPLATLASGEACTFCRENLAAGLELYGGLGSTEGFGFHNTAHYIAPAIAWQISGNSSLRFSPGVGLTRGSNPVLLRFGYTYEVRDFGSHLARVFGGKP